VIQRVVNAYVPTEFKLANTENTAKMECVQLTECGRNGANSENVYQAVVQVTRNELESVLAAKEMEWGVRVTILKKLAV